MITLNVRAATSSWCIIYTNTMVSYAWLLIKRIAVLIPGALVAYISARAIFPYFDKRLPLAIAIFATYVLGAYVLIPVIARSWRVVVPAKHAPVYCVTPDGYASDPINIGIIGSRRQLVEAMEKAGWHVADPYSLRNAIFGLVAILLRKAYHGAPMSALFLFGRKQDIGFEKQLTEHGRGHRHHVRFWATTYDQNKDLSTRTIHWEDRKVQLIAEDLLWVGAASRDIGIAIASQSLQFTHAVAPDTNSERELIAGELTGQDLAEPVTTLRLNKPYQLVNFAWSRSLQSDGKMAVLRLKK
ncbi:MAG TPA: LssY C-terminal domain-containing protein [Candidatus Saccharimonadales bacterium]|nr:LssY C-terminal domain-containing protein [Candidatus Saccharimonadales bacterium]